MDYLFFYFFIIKSFISLIAGSYVALLSLPVVLTLTVISPSAVISFKSTYASISWADISLITSSTPLTITGISVVLSWVACTKKLLFKFL